MPGTDMIVAEREGGKIALASSPFVSNQYHFGMLLGVADLEAEQAYHRGKTWLHNAWLHGTGVVWGLKVGLNSESNELVVKPGLALDGHGRELVVTAEMCADLVAWYEENNGAGLPEPLPDGTVEFVVHVELCHDSCLDRPVPSISEPCDASNFDTAYSRAIERGLPRIVAGPAPELPPLSYPRLRQFFGQDRVTDPVVAQAHSEIANVDDPAAGPAECVKWFRILAAEDTMALGPAEGATGYSPAAGDGCVPLAQLTVRLLPDGESFTLVTDGANSTTIDNHVRPSHVRTNVIQELLCHHVGATEELVPGDSDLDIGDTDTDDGGETDAAPTPTVIAGPGVVGGTAPEVGPQLEPDSVAMSGTTISMRFDRPLNRATVGPDAFEAAALRTDGWDRVTIERVEIDDDDRTVHLELPGARRTPVRLVALGTNAEPILGANGEVLTGNVGDRRVRTGANSVAMIPAPAVA